MSYYPRRFYWRGNKRDVVEFVSIDSGWALDEHMQRKHRRVQPGYYPHTHSSWTALLPDNVWVDALGVTHLKEEILCIFTTIR